MGFFMRADQILETTTAGSVASVASPVGKVQTRAGGLFKGKKTNKPFYKSKMKDLEMDLKGPPDGLTDIEFKKKYGKSKDEMRKSLHGEKDKVDEAKLEEDDLILVPGQGQKLKPGFIPREQDRRDHEVEMARADLYNTAKNAKILFNIMADRSEDEGLEGWIQEKIIKANDYLNAAREHMEQQSKMKANEMTGGVLAGGMANEAVMSPDELGRKNAMEIMAAVRDSRSATIMLGDEEVLLSYPEARFISGYLKQAQKEGRIRDFLPIMADPIKFDKLMAKLRAMLDKQKQVPNDVSARIGEPGMMSEKAKSVAQQRFMGMAHAMQKGAKIPGASKELKDVAKSMKKGDVKDFAKTKHKGLPQHVAKKD